MELPRPVFPETEFNARSSQYFVSQNFKYTFVVSVIYVILVHVGKNYMANRPPMDLRKPLVVWSSLLAVFSIIGTIRTTPEFVHSLVKHGFQYSVCSFSYFDSNQVSGFWTMMFVWSKYAELFDTMFIVLRKKKLMVLHWYHHFSVLVYVWYLISVRGGAGRWFLVMNFSIHSAMYSYYALSAARIHVPKKVPFFITCAQILQMVVGWVISCRMLHYWWEGDICDLNLELVVVSNVMYFSYLILFLNFFVKTYLEPTHKKRS